MKVKKCHPTKDNHRRDIEKDSGTMRAEAEEGV
jgi:hypothetical protein